MLLGGEATRKVKTKTVQYHEESHRVVILRRIIAVCLGDTKSWCQKGTIACVEKTCTYSIIRLAILSSCWKAGRLTKSTEDCVGETIANQELPLRSDNQSESCNEKEVCDKDIIGRDTALFHETQRKSRQGCSECAQS